MSPPRISALPLLKKLLPAETPGIQRLYSSGGTTLEAPGDTSPCHDNARTHGDDFYRHDLDGLRGVAIALVAVYHIWFGKVSGGVDVFLALSGFFFGGKLLRTSLNPASSLSVRPTIEIMARRLLPALVSVIAACVVLTVLVLPQTRWRAFATQCLASMGYYQNWELSSTVGDYLRAGSSASPLQHIWSMSIQGQFYIAFLTLVFGTAWVIRKTHVRHPREVMYVLLAAVTISSFVYALHVRQINESTAYYNSFARVWELSITTVMGGLIPYVKWTYFVRSIVTVAALFLIFGCGVFLDGAHDFPGPWTLIPIGGTVMLILANANRNTDNGHVRAPLLSRVLASRPLVQLGKMAYSLYLWHWPLLVFWLAYTNSHHMSFMAGGVLLLVSCVLAHLTLTYVEHPIRYGRRGSVASVKVGKLVLPGHQYARVLGVVVVLLGVATTSTAFAWKDHFAPRDLKLLSALNIDKYPGARALDHLYPVPDAQPLPSPMDAGRDVPVSTSDGCISDFSSLDVKVCRYGDASATRTIAVAGGSHAEHWITALDLLGKQHHFAVTTYLKMGCPLTTDPDPVIIGSDTPYPKCHVWVGKALDQLVIDHPDFVFTTTTRPILTQPGDMVPDSYVGVWKLLVDHGIPILGIRDTPWNTREGFPFDPVDCLAGKGTPIACGMSRSSVLSKDNPTSEFLARFPDLKSLDLSNWFCTENVCPAVIGNVTVYRDTHHMTATYNKTLTDALGGQLGAATGWW